jgi:hypothetical protein
MNNALGYNFRMSLRSVPIFLTFVLCAILATSEVSIAAPSPTSPSLDETDTSVQDDKASADQELKSQTVIVTPPPAGPNTRPAENEYFHPYRQALSARLGQVMSSFEGIDDAKSKSWVVGGLQYLFTTRANRFYEAGADLNSEGSGTLHLQRRWIFSRAKFRPYTKAGGGVIIIPSEGLVSFLRMQNWQLRGAGGAEQLVWRKLSVRAEIEATLSQNGYWLIGSIGFVWPW